MLVDMFFLVFGVVYILYKLISEASKGTRTAMFKVLVFCLPISAIIVVSRVVDTFYGYIVGFILLIAYAVIVFASGLLDDKKADDHEGQAENDKDNTPYISSKEYHTKKYKHWYDP